MKRNLLLITKTLVFTAAASISFAFTGWAANIQGELTNVGSSTISGWAWNKEDTNDVQIELRMRVKGSSNLGC